MTLAAPPSTLATNSTMLTWGQGGVGHVTPQITIAFKGASLTVGFSERKTDRVWATLDMPAGRVVLHVFAEENDRAISDVWPQMQMHITRSDRRTLTRPQTRAASEALHNGLLFLRAEGHLDTLARVSGCWRGEKRLLEISAEIAELQREHSELEVSLATLR